MAKLQCESADLTQANIARLKELFPSVVTEARDENGRLRSVVNFDALRRLLGDEAAAGEEAYEFTWVGKNAAALEAGRPIRKTLRPCKEESRDWETTQNLYIEGDNLEVLKLLQESYIGRVKMIYIDPPYNTGNDFIYRDDFKMGREEYELATGSLVENEEDERQRMFRNTDSNGRFHSDWCSMIYPRLLLARNLLSDDGVIFISCDDNEQENLKKICNEVFGERNFVSELIWKSKSGGANDSKYFAIDHEYILCYAKNINNIKILIDKESNVSTNYNMCDENGKYALDRLDKQSIRYSKSLDFPIIGPEGKQYFPQHKDPKHPNATWRWGCDTVQQRYGELVFKNGYVYTKNYKKDGVIPRSLLIEERYGRTRTGKTDNYNLFELNLFSNPKPYKLIRYMNMIFTAEDDIILDFFSGSATTAHAVMQLNAEDGGKRKFIMVQLPEVCAPDSEAAKAGYKNICEIGKERIRRAGDKIKKENADKPGIENLDTGFRVLKCDSTNMEDVYFTPAELDQASLTDQISNIKPDRTDMDLLFGCLTEWGLPLSLRHETVAMDGYKVHFYDENALACCFDADISEAAIIEMAKRKPLRAVFRDASFRRSQDRINAGELFKNYSPDTDVRVL